MRGQAQPKIDREPPGSRYQNRIRLRIFPQNQQRNYQNLEFQGSPGPKVDLLRFSQWKNHL